MNAHLRRDQIGITQRRRYRHLIQVRKTDTPREHPRKIEGKDVWLIY